MMHTDLLDEHAGPQAGPAGLSSAMRALEAPLRALAVRSLDAIDLSRPFDPGARALAEPFPWT